MEPVQNIFLVSRMAKMRLCNFYVEGLNFNKTVIIIYVPGFPQKWKHESNAVEKYCL